MPLNGALHVFYFPGFHKANLRGFIAVLLFGLPLNYNAGARLDDSDRDNISLRVKNLRHSNFDSDQTVRHCAAPHLCSAPKALISTSIAAGRSSFINWSTV